MATDDDKQMPEPDPWAGLNIDGVEDAGDDGAFDFDGVGDEAVAGEDAAVRGDAAPQDGERDLSAGEIPLVVFPPPDGESAGSEIDIGTGQSGIISMTDAADNAAADDFGGIGDVDGGDDAFDDKDIAHELGLLDVDGESLAEEALASGGDPASGDDLAAAADFGEPLAEANSDDVSFDAGMMGGASPFADSDQVAPLADAVESGQDDLASIPLNAAMTGAAVAATGAVVAAAGGRPAAAKKKAGGLGQMVGVVLGGLMALPITYAILIWGFQKDPFKLGKQVPSQLAFLLPQKLQPGYKPPRKAAAGPSLDAAPSLDDLPSVDEASLSTTPEAEATAAAEPAEGKPAEAADSEQPAEPAEPAESEPMKTEAVAGSPAEPAAPGTAETSLPAESAQPASETTGKSVASENVVVAPPTIPAASSLAALPSTDVLPGLDALIADAAAATPAPAAVAAALPPLDLTGVEMAAERAAEAFESLDAMTDPVSPDRDRLLVVWYKRLARLGEELARLETMAADSGRPLSPTPVAAADLLDRVCVSETAVADLDRLGGMWLTSQKRRADGVSLVVTLGPSRQVGPYWSTRGLVAGGQEDGSDRSLSIISRLAPPADAGDRVVVSGVVFDGDAVWAADMRPVAVQPLSDGEPE
jgi:hypothetical protein